MTNSKSDQIFQLSLTEIAFTIAFILLLLLGHLIIKEQTAKDKAVAELATIKKLEEVQVSHDLAVAKLRNELMNAGVQNPDDVISKLVAESQAQTERDQLLVKVKDLEAQISSLTEVKQMLSEIKNEEIKKHAVETLLSAVALQKEIKDALKPAEDKPDQAPTATVLEQVKRSIELAKAVDQALQKYGASPLPKGKEAETINTIVQTAETLRQLKSAGKDVDAIFKENSDLRSQVAFYVNRDKLRGLDHPPCWMDANGKIEYIFTIQTRPDGYAVMRGWLPHRENDAKNSNGFSALMVDSGTPLSSTQFAQAAKAYLDYGKAQSPECRHFAYLSSSIADADRRDAARRLVNSFFYVLESNRSDQRKTE